ncbi:MAG: hypothetical protein J3Q66DRAFT_368224 [Benniella sp.]|nr:MAG: hypothetical protein J3Q66DRAFT_368224 [Benniella sp.]
MAGKHLQDFRVVSASSSTPTSQSTISIASRFDEKTGERIVLWRHIQQAIKNADHVRNGNTFVVFMTDDNFEESSKMQQDSDRSPTIFTLLGCAYRLIPQRILYHPGVVLDVIVEGQERTVSLSSETLGSPRRRRGGGGRRR